MRSISVGPVNDLSFVQSENIKSVKSIESDNPQKPFCLNIEFHNGKSKLIYFLLEDDANKNIRKIKTEMQKVFKNNNFQKILPEIPKTKTRKSKKAELKKAEAKAKKTAKSKATAKAKPKVKATAKAKPKVKATANAKPKVKATAKAKPKVKATAKAKTKVKATAKAKTKVKATVKAKTKVKATVKAKTKKAK